MLKRYNYTAYPTLEQENLFAQTFGCVRVVYNKYVEHGKNTKHFATYKQACENLLPLKAELEWLQEVSSIPLQQTLKDAHQAVTQYWKSGRKTRLPRFKKRSNRQSFRIVGNASFKVRKLNDKWSEVKLPKTEPLKFRTERPLPSVPKSVTVIKHPSGKYEVSFVVEVEPIVLPDSQKALSIDLGLTDYATLVDTNGTVSKIPNPRYYRKSEARLAKLQQSHARKEKGSKNREKARVKVARQHEKIAKQRKDYVRKLVNVMVGENQTIITETLAVKNMVKNRILSKSIMDASWGIFLTSLSAKCAETGRFHILVDRFFPSSKTCSHCGVLKESLVLSERNWTCKHCDRTHDRDINAAVNLLVVGLSELAAGRVESINASVAGGTMLQELVLHINPVL